MKKKLLFGAISTVIAIGVFLVVLLAVQYLNTDLNDVNLIVNNFKRVQTLTDKAVVTDTKDESNKVIYRIEDTGLVLVLETDKEWVNGQMGMVSWSETEDLQASTESIMEKEPTHWLLSLSETKVGPWMLYKEINMNKQANTNMDSILNTIFESVNQAE